MASMKKEELVSILKEIMERDEEILFAYLYGSYALDANYWESDIDIAIYLKPTDITEYIKKEQELLTTLIVALHNDHIDLRILNTLPLLLKYRIIKEGIPILIKDELERADFDTGVMNRFFELKPFWDEYDRMFRLRLATGYQNGEEIKRISISFPNILWDGFRKHD
jgi:hypothetical protein